MVDSAQSHRQLGGSKLLGKLQSIASDPTLTLLARAIPSKPKTIPASQAATATVGNASIEKKISILKKMRQSFNPGNSSKQSMDHISPPSLPSDPIVFSTPTDQVNFSLPSSSQSDDLAALDEAIAQVEAEKQVETKQQVEAAPILEGSLAQALPQATQHAVMAAQPQVGGRSLAKESAVGAIGLDQIAGDMAGMVGGPAETEPPKELEIPVEVESYLEKVENHADQLPQEIVVADDGANIVSRPYPKQPVIVLPVTPDIEKVGASKSPSYSVRWLVEWSRKIMKMFEGMVIYRQDVSN